MSNCNKIYKSNGEIIVVPRKKIIIDDNDIIDSSDNDMDDYEKADSKITRLADFE